MGHVGVAPPAPHAPSREAALRDPARALDPRAALVALRLPDVLAPGEWTPGAYAGESRDQDPQRAFARRAVEAAPEPVSTPDWTALRKRFGCTVIYRGERSGDEDGIVSFRLTLPAPDLKSLDFLGKVVQGRDVVADSGSVWVENDGLIGFTGTRFVLDVGRERKVSLVLA